MIGKIRRIIFELKILLAGEYKRADLYTRYLGVKFGKNVRFTGRPSFGSEPYLITIGNNVTITQGVTFHNHDGGVGIFREKHPNIEIIKKITVGDNVFIGSHVTIMPGVVIGNNVIIGASSVVTKDIPDNVVVAGIPARAIKSIQDYEDKMLEHAIYINNRKDPEKRKEEIMQALGML